MSDLSQSFLITLMGSETVGPWCGRVHSIFDKSVNVLVGERRITLVTNPLWISEHNIVFNDRKIIDLIAPESQLAVENSHFYIDGYAITGIAGVPIWQMPPLLSVPIRDGALQLISVFLSGQQGDKISQIIEQQFKALSEQFMHTGYADFSRIVGAGYGLTPTGDDMLVGFALAIACYQPQRLDCLARLCQPYLAYTTDISRYLLQDALQGQFSAPLINLLIALQQNQNITQAISVAANIGSSSGRDGIWGLNQGLKLSVVLN